MFERLRETGILPARLREIGALPARLRTAGLRPDADDAAEEVEPRFQLLRLVVAELFLATGFNATLEYVRGRADARNQGDDVTELALSAHNPTLRPRVIGWAPALLAPMAGVAQVVHAYRPSDGSRLATRILSGAALGVGVAGLAESVTGDSRGLDRFTLGPLLFAYAGALAYLLERQERQVEEEREELSHRASLLERIVPQRRAKLDRIVVHV